MPAGGGGIPGCTSGDESEIALLRQTRGALSAVLSFRVKRAENVGFLKNVQGERFCYSIIPQAPGLPQGLLPQQKGCVVDARSWFSAFEVR